MSNEERNYASNPAVANVFIGRVAAAPEFSKHGETKVTTFTLIDNVYAGKDESGAKSRPLSIRFTAFNAKAEAIRDHATQGDQLIVFYTMRNNNFTDKDGIERYGYEFVVDSFRFGSPGAAKRAELDMSVA